MDLMKINNGYNPYLIKGYGGLGYHPYRNIVGTGRMFRIKGAKTSGITTQTMLEHPDVKIVSTKNNDANVVLTSNTDTSDILHYMTDKNTDEDDREIMLNLLELQNKKEKKERDKYLESLKEQKEAFEEYQTMAKKNPRLEKAYKQHYEEKLKKELQAKQMDALMKQVDDIIKKKKKPVLNLQQEEELQKQIKEQNEKYKKVLKEKPIKIIIPKKDILKKYKKVENKENITPHFKKVYKEAFKKNIEYLIGLVKQHPDIADEELMHQKADESLKALNELSKFKKYKIENWKLVEDKKEAKAKKIYTPQEEREELELSNKKLIKSKNRVLESPNKKYNKLTEQLNSNNIIQMVEETFDTLNNIYEPKDDRPTKYILADEIAQFYDTVNYDAGKDLEALFMENEEALNYLLENMTSRVEEDEIEDIEIDVGLSDEMLKNTILKGQADYFPFDGILKFYKQGKKKKILRDMMFLEFKKYSDLKNSKYKKYNSLQKLKEEFIKKMEIMFYITKAEIYDLFLDFINDEITEKELNKSLEKFCDFENGKPELNIRKLEEEYINNYAYLGIPVKHTKFIKIENELIIPQKIKFQADVNHLKSIAKQIKFTQDLDEEGRVENLIWSGSEEKKNEYEPIIESKFFSEGMAGDIIIVVGLSDAILVCNYSQKIREGFIDKHPVNNLQLVKSAYSNTYDHYNIPIEWFNSIEL